MEVQARHHFNHFLPQNVSNIELAAIETSGHVSSTPAAAAYGGAEAVSAVPMYGFPANPRKRPRDYYYYYNSCLDDSFGHYYNTNTALLGEDVALQIHQQQLDMGQFVSQHTEKVRVEIEERRKRYTKLIAHAVEQDMTKKLKAKEEELMRICRVNLDLEQRVKSLSVENQLWRDMAQTADALRRNLEQELAQQQLHVAELQSQPQLSSCGSSGNDDRRTSADAARLCRRCESEESCVLVLPCRHLCLCAACGSSMHTCPVCSSVKTATVRVNV